MSNPHANHQGEPGDTGTGDLAQRIAHVLYTHNAYIEALWQPDPTAPYEGAVCWSEKYALALANGIITKALASAPTPPDRVGEEVGRELVEAACLKIQNDAQEAVERFNGKGMPSEAWLSQGVAIGASRCAAAVRAALASASAPSHDPAGAGGDLVSYLHRQWAWSKETFGPALRTKGIVQHITKELREIEAEPHDLAEWVDVIILAMDGFWRHGGKPEDLLPAMQAKQDRNFARTWPDWRTMGEDQAIEHDRSGETPQQSPSPTPETDPPMSVEEAREILRELDPKMGAPELQAEELRAVAKALRGGAPIELLVRAGRIEAALRTLQAAGEVRS